MGLFDFFRARRQRESAVESLEITAEPSSEVSPLSATFGEAGASPSAAGGGMDLGQLGQIGKLIAQAAKDGNIQVHVGEPQTIDMGGSGDLQQEILGIMSRYGVGAEATSAEGIDAGRMPQMQQEIMDAIARQGFDLNAFLPGDTTPDQDGTGTGSGA